MVNCRIYSIEGNIGSGKSTLVTMLKRKFNNNKIVFLDEPVDVWTSIKDKSGETVLSKFYADQDKYAFSFQMMAYVSRVARLREAVRENPNAIIITERCVLTDKNVFAKMLYDDDKIEDINYQIYLKWFDEFSKDLPIIGIIYVKASPNICYDRVVIRARDGETIPLSYLENCHNYHEDWLKEQEVVLTLNANQDKEKTEEAYETWISIIEKFMSQKSKPNYSFDKIKDIMCSTRQYNNNILLYIINILSIRANIMSNVIINFLLKWMVV